MCKARGVFQRAVRHGGAQKQVHTRYMRRTLPVARRRLQRTACEVRAVTAARPVVVVWASWVG